MWRLLLFSCLLTSSLAQFPFLACDEMHRTDVLNFYPVLNLTNPIPPLIASTGDLVLILFQSPTQNQIIQIDLKNFALVPGDRMHNWGYLPPVQVMSMAHDNTTLYMLENNNKAGAYLSSWELGTLKLITRVQIAEDQDPIFVGILEVDQMGFLHVLGQTSNRLILMKITNLTVIELHSNVQILIGENSYMAIDTEKGNIGVYSYYTELTFFRTKDDSPIGSYKSPSPIVFIPRGSIQETVYVGTTDQIESVTTGENRLSKTLDFSVLGGSESNRLQVTWATTSSVGVTYWSFSSPSNPLIVRLSPGLDVLNSYELRPTINIPGQPPMQIYWTMMNEEEDVLYAVNSMQQLYKIEGAGCHFSLPWPVWTAIGILAGMIVLAILGAIFRRIVGPYQLEDPVQVQLLKSNDGL